MGLLAGLSLLVALSLLVVLSLLVALSRTVALLRTVALSRAGAVLVGGGHKQLEVFDKSKRRSRTAFHLDMKAFEHDNQSDKGSEVSNRSHGAIFVVELCLALCICCQERYTIQVRKVTR